MFNFSGRILTIKLIICILLFSIIAPSISYASAENTEKYLFITENTSILFSQTTDKIVVIAPNATLTIVENVEYTVNTDIIIYGTVINKGELRVNRSIFANNYNNFLFGDQTNPAGKLSNQGTMRVGTLIVNPAKYPTPILTITEPKSESIVSTRSVQVKGDSYPGLQLDVSGPLNSDGQTTNSSGLFSREISLSEGLNEINITITDPFGNKNTKEIIVTSIAPLEVMAPTVNEVTDHSTVVTGTADAGLLIQVKVDGNEIGTGTTKLDGTYSVSITKQMAGKELAVTATDKYGNLSVATKIIIKDATAPPAPKVDEVTDQSTIATGIAEAGSTIQVKVDGDEIGTGTTKLDGTYSVSITKQTAGKELTVTATDKYGNLSVATKIIIKDATAPPAPKVDEVTDQSTIVTGIAETGSIIQVKVDDNEIGIGTTKTDGTYSVSIAKQMAGKELLVTATDQSGNLSMATKKVVKDVTAPLAPKVNEVTDQSTVVTGTAETGSLIQVKLDNNEIRTSTTRTNGSFSVTISKQEIGKILVITSSDVTGNVSEPTVVKVKDGTAPSAPKVNEVTDQSTIVTGTAEAGSLIQVEMDDNEIGTDTTKADGTYSVNIAKQMAGKELLVTAADQSGNLSDATKIIIKDVTPPSAPRVNNITDQSNKVTGEAEVGAVITVKAGNITLGSDSTSFEGKYSVNIEKQSENTVLTITAQDIAGNISGATTVNVTDGTAPLAPTVHSVTDQSLSVTGKAEAYATVTVKSGVTVIGSGKSSLEGTYSVPIEKQSESAILTVTVTDAKGNTSKETLVEVTDGTAPVAPTADPVNENSWSITGSAEAGSYVLVKVGNTILGGIESLEDGKYEAHIAEAQKAGTVLTITATDKAGNVSPSYKVTVIDETAPLIPMVDKLTHKSTVLTGFTEANAEIFVLKEAKTIAYGKATADGEFRLTVSKQVAGTKLEIYARDSAGNESEKVSIIVEQAAVKETMRISGPSRYDTAISISKTGWKAADTVILATAGDFPDALAGGPLAYQVDGPILLTRTAYLPRETKEEIKRLGAKRVIVLGSNGAVSLEVEKELREMRLAVERIGGKNRYDTAAMIALRLNSTEAVIAYGSNFPDVLSVSAYASRNEIPILLTRSDKLPAETKEALQLISKTYVIGSSGVVGDTVFNSLPNPVRYGGSTRYETGLVVNKLLQMGNEKAFIATGTNFPDALAGSVLAAKNNAPILLVASQQIPEATERQLEVYSDFYIFGGNGAVSEEIKESLDEVLKN